MNYNGNSRLSLGVLSKVLTDKEWNLVTFDGNVWEDLIETENIESSHALGFIVLGKVTLFNPRL